MQQAWFDTLDGMEQELVRKAENVAVYIKNMESEAKTLKAEEDKLKARRQAKERNMTLSAYCIESLDRFANMYDEG